MEDEVLKKASVLSEERKKNSAVLEKKDRRCTETTGHAGSGFQHPG